MRRAADLVLVFAACTACASEPAPAPDPTVLQLSPADRLIRASAALRGMRPSLAELQQVDADPAAFEEIVARYLSTPEFATTIREMHDEALLMRVQPQNYNLIAIGPLVGVPFEQLEASLYQEPLRLIEDVVMTDSPYTKIVTADYTMADALVATIWGMPHSPALGWERTHYPDHRGAVGILGASSYYLRHRSTGFNFNRGRAARFAKALLCHDFTAGMQIDTSVNLSDPNAIASAVTTNPGCVGCHETLDPLASYFFQYYQGLIVTTAVMSYPMEWMYTEADADKWWGTTYRKPSYFGKPAEGLAGLGRSIAADPRFAECTVSRFASYLTETPIETLDAAWIARLRKQFIDSGYNARQLVRAIVFSDQFATVASTDPARSANLVGYAKVRPQQLSRMLHDLTGFRWAGRMKDPVFPTFTELGDVDFMDDDILGFRVLMGGIDSFYVTEPVHTMNATSSLVVRELAMRAAQFVVRHDAVAPDGERTLFVIPPTATDDESVRAQLAHLHARVFGELHDPDLTASFALFHDALAASGDAQRAWVVTLTAMFSDLRVVYY